MRQPLIALRRHPLLAAPAVRLLVLLLQRRDPIGAKLLSHASLGRLAVSLADAANRHEVRTVERQPWVGGLADRLGNRPVMMVSQLLVAVGLLFFAAATPEHWAWFVGAWVLWIAYAGLNVCLPNLLLKLSPERSNTPYIAAFYAVTGLCYAASTIVGGALVDQCGKWAFPLGGGRWLGFFPYLFLFGWAARSLGSLVLLLVIEPMTKRDNV